MTEVGVDLALLEREQAVGALIDQHRLIGFGLSGTVAVTSSRRIAIDVDPLVMQTRLPARSLNA